MEPSRRPELSSMESKGSLGRPGSSGPFLFFHFCEGQDPLRLTVLRIARQMLSLVNLFDAGGRMVIAD
jgi:hypothetical protein